MRIVRPSAARDFRQFRAVGDPDDRLPKSAWKYVHLICGHMTTPEEQAFFRVWRPKKKEYWCTQCGKWLAKASPIKHDAIPEEPMF